MIKGLDLDIMTGKTTVLAGESGSGKSVLLKVMKRLIIPDEGEVVLFGKSLSKISEKERIVLHHRCTMVFQSYALIDSMTVAVSSMFPLA